MAVLTSHLSGCVWPGATIVAGLISHGWPVRIGRPRPGGQGASRSYRPWEWCRRACPASLSGTAAYRQRRSAGAKRVDQGGDDLVQVADDGVVGVGQDGGARVGVDRDDVLRAGAAGDVLNGAADAAG